MIIHFEIEKLHIDFFLKYFEVGNGDERQYFNEVYRAFPQSSMLLGETGYITTFLFSQMKVQSNVELEKVDVNL